MYMVSILHTNTDTAKSSKGGGHLELHVSSDLDYQRGNEYHVGIKSVRLGNFTFHLCYADCPASRNLSVPFLQP